MKKIRSILITNFIPILILSSIYTNNFFMLSSILSHQSRGQYFITTPCLDRISNNQYIPHLPSPLLEHPLTRLPVYGAWSSKDRTLGSS